MGELKNVPKEIYINVGDDEHCEIDFNFDDLTDVTWCTHAIDDNDIKYYLADYVDKQNKQLKQRNKELEAYINTVSTEYKSYDPQLDVLKPRSAQTILREVKQLLKGKDDE